MLTATNSRNQCFKFHWSSFIKSVHKQHSHMCREYSSVPFEYIEILDVICISVIQNLYYIFFMKMIFLRCVSVRSDDFFGNWAARIKRIQYQYPCMNTNIFTQLCWLVWVSFVISKKKKKQFTNCTWVPNSLQFLG